VPAIGLIEWRTNRCGNLRLDFYGPRRDEPLAKPSSERDEILDSRTEFTHIERLRQIVIGAAVQSRETLIDAGMRSEQNDRQEIRVRTSADRTHERVTVGVRHHEIAHDHIGQLAPRDVDSVRTVCGFEDTEPRSEMVAHVCTEVGAVVDDQQRRNVIVDLADGFRGIQRAMRVGRLVRRLAAIDHDRAGLLGVDIRLA